MVVPVSAGLQEVCWMKVESAGSSAVNVMTVESQPKLFSRTTMVVPVSAGLQEVCWMKVESEGSSAVNVMTVESQPAVFTK